MYTIDANALTSAVRGPVLRSLLRFKNKPATSWLAIGHAAERGELPSSWSRLRAANANQVIDAVAICAPHPCMDGWSFISRALAALLAGDPHASRHLAYYAQLRAGLSILANLGIGIFNGVNFSIVGAGQFRRIDPRTDGKTSNKGIGTHTIVWDALQQWSRNPATASIFLDLIKIQSTPLRACLEAIWPGTSTTTSVTSLIEAWGLDLRRGADEHRFRNISSYAPQAFNPLPNIALEQLDFIEEVWSLLEPSVGPNLDKLDRHLLRATLWQHHHAVAGGPVAQGAIEQRFDKLPAEVAAIASKEFLTGLSEPDEPMVVKLARAKTDPAAAKEMISRALLLLRAATSFTYSSLADAGIKCANGELRPWLDELASARGFWKPTAPLADPVDLWADVELGLDELRASKASAPACLYDWMINKSKGLPIICEVERVGVWSFCG